MTARDEVKRLVVFGDPEGAAQLLTVGGAGLRCRVVGLVGAAIRPAQHEVLRTMAGDGGWPLLIQPKPAAAGYPAFVRRLAGLGPDLILVNSYAMLLRDDALGAARLGGVNIHGGPLPEMRGANPVEWSLIEDRGLAGVTMHELDEGIDSGPIIAQRRVPVSFHDTWHDVRRNVMAATSAMLAEMLPSVLRGEIVGVAQDETLAHHHPRRRAEDGRFEWSWPVRRIYNLIRALIAPHPGAFVEQYGRREVYAEYLPVAEVARLKYDPRRGAQVFADPEVALRPVRLPGAGADDVGLEILDRPGSTVLGTVRISGRDWCAGLGDCRLGVHGRWRDRAARLVTRFAAEELRLTRLDHAADLPC